MLVLILLLAAGAYAQESRGTIVGRVTDPSGSVVPRATIKIRSAQTGITSTLSSNERGSYYAPLLNSGLHTISVEKEGFRPFTGEVRVRVGDRLEVNIRLQVSGVSQTVEVEDDTPLLDTASEPSSAGSTRRPASSATRARRWPTTSARCRRALRASAAMDSIISICRCPR
jgi:hypothetical protein